MTTPSNSPAGTLPGGVLLLGVAHAIAALIAFLTAEGLSSPEIWFTFLIVIGLVQLLWGVPLALWQRRVGHRRTALGVWLGIGITLLVNAGCWGYFLSEGVVH